MGVNVPSFPIKIIEILSNSVVIFEINYWV